MENILGAAPGNFSFAYEQYMKATSLYEISLVDHNYLYGEQKVVPVFFKD